MKEKDIIDINSLSKDLQIIIKAMLDGKDSECAIIGASYIDKCLYNFLYNNIPTLNKKFILEDLFAIELGPLGNYSSKNKICYAFNFIDEKIYYDIKNIGIIRNRFAHNYLITLFSDKDVAKYCARLTLWENHFTYYKIEEINSMKPKLTNDILKQIFVYSSIDIMQKLVS